MTTQSSKAMTLLAAGALVLVGYFLGSMNQSRAVAQDAAAAEPVKPQMSSGAIGVTIPNGGAAVVKGSDGNAYLISQRGVFTRVAQAGKSLPLD